MGLFDLTPKALKEADEANTFHLTVPQDAKRPKGSTDPREGTWSEIVLVEAAEYETDPEGVVVFELACRVSPESPHTENHNRNFRARYRVSPKALREKQKDDWTYIFSQRAITTLRSLYKASGVEGDMEGEDGQGPGYSKNLQESFYGPESTLVGTQFWVKIGQRVRIDKSNVERVNTDVSHWLLVD